MNIVVYKGIIAFEYEVLRAPNGTRAMSNLVARHLLEQNVLATRAPLYQDSESPAARFVATLAKTTVAGGTDLRHRFVAVYCTSNLLIF